MLKITESQNLIDLFLVFNARLLSKKYFEFESNSLVFRLLYNARKQNITIHTVLMTNHSFFAGVCNYFNDFRTAINQLP